MECWGIISDTGKSNILTKSIKYVAKIMLAQSCLWAALVWEGTLLSNLRQNSKIIATKPNLTTEYKVSLVLVSRFFYQCNQTHPWLSVSKQFPVRKLYLSLSLSLSRSPRFKKMTYPTSSEANKGKKQSLLWNFAKCANIPLNIPKGLLY